MGHRFLVQGSVKADFSSMAIDIEAEISPPTQADGFGAGDALSGQEIRLELDVCSPLGEWRTFGANYLQQERRFRARIPLTAIDVQRLPKAVTGNETRLSPSFIVEVASDS